MNTKQPQLRLIKNPTAIYTQQGLFQFNNSIIPSAAVLADLSVITRLYGVHYKLDHIAIVLKDVLTWQGMIDNLVNRGGLLIEGPALFPQDFCRQESVPADLNFHFASVALPTGLTIVLSASHREGDQLSGFIKQRGEGIHHLAVNVNSESLSDASANWRSFNFMPLSSVVDDGELAQQFLINPQGQVLELIERNTSGLGTFSCGNITHLRLAEKKAA